ncbi:MAG: hypothetical protein IJW51_04960 [Clostridia bacterium]|nr:hypothetical protein [Clostridia bacterium]
MRFNRVFLCFLCLIMLTLNACGASASSPAATDENRVAVGEEDFIDTLTFLGDSTTAHMLSRAPLKDGKGSKQVWATKSRYLNLGPRITHEKIVCPDGGEEMTIAEVAAKIRPACLVITLGIDYGVYYYRDDPKAFALCYEKLLDAIAEASPETQILLQSIFPVGRSSTAITNDMVDRANGVIRDIAARRGLVFVDANTILKDEDGYLAPRYCYSEDGIHLTQEAYEKIFENLKSYRGEVLKRI